MPRLALIALGVVAVSACAPRGADSSTTDTPTAGAREPIGLDAPPDAGAPPVGSQTTESGLASRVLYPGHGESPPGPNDGVSIHYTMWTVAGQRVDSSVARGEPARLNLGRMIDGMNEALQLMVEGERRRVWIPGSLAYEGRAGPQGPLVIDVELLSIRAAAPAPPTPEHVAAPPPEAQRSASGLAWVVLASGNGDRHPDATSRVTVHYSGWRAETGGLFDSSVTRGDPSTFTLNRVIAGWTEGVQLMVVGERRRFWIPVELAYRGRPNRPAGMLVFDIELLAIE